MKKGILIMLIVLLLGVFLFSGWKLASTLLEYREGEKAYEELDQFVSVPAPTQPKRKPSLFQEPEKTPEEPTEPTEPEEIFPWPEVDFAALLEVNSDVVGWIYIPDTKVNYPVVQGKNNDQYLYRLINGKRNSSGSIFLEANNASDFSEQNNAIFGHNMKNGSMFAGITGYKRQEFFDKHPYALLLTPEKRYVVRLFSGYVTDAWGDAWDMTFTQERYQTWLDQRVQKSYFSSDVVPGVDDCVLTFSTCSYETAEGRFVVHGILEEYGNKTAVD